MKKILILASILVASSVTSFAQQLNASPVNDNVKQENQRQKNRVPAVNNTPATKSVVPPATLSHNNNTISNVNTQQPATTGKVTGIPLHKQVSPTGHFVPQKISPASK